MLGHIHSRYFHLHNFLRRQFVQLPSRGLLACMQKANLSSTLQRRRARHIFPNCYTLVCLITVMSGINRKVSGGRKMDNIHTWNKSCFHRPPCNFNRCTCIMRWPFISCKTNWCFGPFIVKLVIKTTCKSHPDFMWSSCNASNPIFLWKWCWLKFSFASESQSDWGAWHEEDMSLERTLLTHETGRWCQTLGLWKYLDGTLPARRHQS